MSSPVVFPPDKRSSESNSAKSDSSEEPESSMTEENSETDDGSQDDRNMDLKVSDNASVALSNAAAKKTMKTGATAFHHRYLRRWRTPATPGSRHSPVTPKNLQSHRLATIWRIPGARMNPHLRISPTPTQKGIPVTKGKQAPAHQTEKEFLQRRTSSN